VVKINKLKGRIVEQGYSVASLADAVSIDRATLYRKIAGKGEKFTIREVAEIAKALQLNKEELNTIFFSHDVA
jgi:hypothetical protein